LRPAAAVVAGSLALLACASPALADEEKPAQEEAKPKSGAAYGRFGLGYDRSSLFLGQPDAISSWGIPAYGQFGARVSEHFAVGGDVVLQAGSTDYGISMYRVAPGAAFEFRSGPLFLTLGPHAVWFGAQRKSNGPANGGFPVADPMLWRLGAGVHGMLGVDVGVVGHLGVFAGVRADIDALVDMSDAAPNGSVFGVVGLSFH
jgi:hypothetical protein